MKILNQLTLLGDLILSGVGRRIRGDFSNATVASRTIVQTDTANAATSFGLMPNGTGNGAAIWLHGSPDTVNASLGLMYTNATEVGISASRIGTGSFLPLAFYTGGTERLRIDPATGNVLATSGALGYGPGTGGTVTQPTSKSTTVTINKPSGRITTSNEAMPAGTVIAFAVNCSHYKSTDTVSLILVNGATGVNYSFWATGAGGFADGQFAIFIKNESAVTLSDTLSLQFNVHKGAIS